MKFKIDHDYHIHSKLSYCSNDERQTAENILQYAVSNDLSELCITDHYWDENVSGASEWYAGQNYPHISSILPLPQVDNVRFYFGCETDLDKFMTLGISDKVFDKFDFIIIPTTHLHMSGFTIEKKDETVPRRAELYLERLDRVLNMDLPFEKVGIAHLTCHLLAPAEWEEHLSVLDLISNEDYRSIFTKFANRSAGFELNFNPSQYSGSDLARVLRPYKIAKEAGCKFYLGSDAHHPHDFDIAISRAEAIIELLQLEEADKFRFHK